MERPRQETLPRDQNVPPFPSWATRTNVAIETLGSTSTWSYRKEVTAGSVACGVDGGKVSVFLEAPMPGPSTGAERGGPQEREILSGGMNPVSPRALRATQPSGRTTRWVMLPLLRERRSQPSGGNCRALHTM